MKKIDAINKAIDIAKLITTGVIKLNNTPKKDLPLLANLPLIKIGSDLNNGKEPNLEHLTPKVFEILIFGSTANKKNDEVGDLDLIVFDNGFFSDFFTSKKENDMYANLSENLELMLNGWLGYDMNTISYLFENDDIDLHVLPLQMLKSNELRKQLASNHHDPLFFENAFSSIMRYNYLSKTFVSTDIDFIVKTN